MIPINETDYNRFVALAQLIYKHKDKKDMSALNVELESEMDIYISDGFVSLEMTGRAIPQDKIKEVFDFIN